MLLLLSLLACKGTPDDTGPVPTFGDGLFEEGCPAPGGALARVIGTDATLPGQDALGSRGDILLANEHAAFVITSPDAPHKTYWYYDGIIADAAPMDGCEPGRDKLREAALVLGELDLGQFTHSILKGFRAESVVVLADGSDGGAAVVRATGTDDTHWLVEYELIGESISDGGRPFSPPYDLEVTVDYTLEPDSPVVRIDYGIVNGGSTDVTLFTAALLNFGGTLEKVAYPSSALSIGGLTLDAGLPWIEATDGAGAYAWSVEGGSLATMRISGIDVAVDIVHAAAQPFRLPPGAGDSRTSFLSVGPSDGVSATEPLAALNPEPLPDQSYTLAAVSGQVVDAGGSPVSGAAIRLQAQAPGRDWGDLDEARSTADGSFRVPVPEWSSAWSYRLVASQPGRDPSEAVEISPGDSDVQLTTSELGTLAWTITEDGAGPGPARIQLRREDGLRLPIWGADTGTTPVPPGEWAYTATRGYEFAPVTGTITVPPSGTAELAVDLVRVLDTTGWASIDTHVHSTDSPDSRVPPETQLLHAAAHGLDLMLRTEHENVQPRDGLAYDVGLDPWITTLTGQEVTATMPEHMTMVGVTADETARGGFIEWYGLDIGEVWEAMSDRGSGVNIFNHPNYLDRVGWDRTLAEPAIDDATVLGLAPDKRVWAWNFDAVEVMNGHASPFMGGNHRFDSWQSFLNAGHRVIPIGCSDDHGGWETGLPRTYFESATDVPSELVRDDVVSAMLGGAVVVSSGAFARVDVGGVGPGGQVEATDGSVELSILVEAIPEIDVTHVVVFESCDEVLSIAADDPTGVVKLNGSYTIDVPADADSTLTVAAFGVERYPDGLPNFAPEQRPRVLTGAIYVDGDGDGQWTAPGGRECSYTLEAP